ncbi:hypothetical protein Kpol_538p41 [Vanderwaltozyma polyspora DSM 70294]|uniref:Dienelactone hydrolase domain-containing protein n=1 Tax=Vanderwaltozyma polyspora (strain ATCC 22028 / DSM 70294 / BCRC 21397 / CBS 2163 / NBRC 10782 / NRRL Y-8283 / UCD 57-17) TaxID=436907 RepID=A7TKF4_VANPO|nr:uncharacterized protein Kpol_538p41 [Vanderwaltozyma polyspora DSM 70294]EDO17281.1 hypothetical protein Kpol_538p41 [Vanderwaltozyma polyspora DSM 70294]
MASNPPGKCCFQGFKHEGKPIGETKELYGVNTYITGQSSSSDKVIVIASDVYGLKLVNTKLVADKFANAGYKVYIPDILFDDAIDVDVNVQDGSFDLQSWLPRHTPEATRAIFEKFLKGLTAEHSPKFLGLIGYCFGAKFAVQQINKTNGIANAIAIAHPSFVSIEEVNDIDVNKPILISAAENDEIFNEEGRHLTEAKLKENGNIYQLDLFSKTYHGYAVRGDIKVPAIKYAIEKTFLDQLYWFNYHSEK